MSEKLCILEFNTAQEAVNFAKEINPESDLYLSIYDIAPNEAWLFILGLCDICKAKDCFFIPASAMEDEIFGCECKNCGNMSVYPQEGSWDDA